MALIKCKDCGVGISKKAVVCPECGAPAKKKTSMFTWLVAVVVGVIIFNNLTAPPGDMSPAAPVVLTAEQKQAREAALLVELKALPASDYRGNLARYNELVVLAPTTALYANKVAHYEAVKQRQALIDYQFDWGDGGAHKNLRAHVVQSLKDPASFEHVESIYSDEKDHLIVAMTYRARNSYGAAVVETTRARCTLAGDCSTF